MTNSHDSVHIDEGEPPVAIMTFSDDTFEHRSEIAFDELCRQLDAGVPCVVVDCSELNTSYSAVIGLVLTVRQRLPPSGLIALVGPELLLRTCRDCRIDRFIPLFSDLQAALVAIRGDGFEGAAPTV